MAQDRGRCSWVVIKGDVCACVRGTCVRACVIGVSVKYPGNGVMQKHGPNPTLTRLNEE